MGPVPTFKMISAVPERDALVQAARLLLVVLLLLGSPGLHLRPGRVVVDGVGDVEPGRAAGLGHQVDDGVDHLDGLLVVLMVHLEVVVVLVVQDQELGLGRGQGVVPPAGQVVP